MIYPIPPTRAICNHIFIDFNFGRGQDFSLITVRNKLACAHVNFGFGGSFLVGGNEGVDGAVGVETSVGGGADVFEGDCLVFGFFLFPAFVAESVEFI